MSVGRSDLGPTHWARSCALNALRQRPAMVCVPLTGVPLTLWKIVPLTLWKIDPRKNRAHPANQSSFYFFTYLQRFSVRFFRLFTCVSQRLVNRIKKLMCPTTRRHNETASFQGLYRLSNMKVFPSGTPVKLKQHHFSRVVSVGWWTRTFTVE